MERLSDERWGQIIGGRQADTYRIQAGDTLWDISVTFFGNGHFWPKLWQLNDSITNPHLIYPGRALQFIPGGIENPPAIALTDVEDEALDQAEQQAQEQVAQIESDIEEGETDQIQTSEGSLSIEVPIIPPSVGSKPIRKILPQSLLKSTLNIQDFLTNETGSLLDQSEIKIETVSAEITESEKNIQVFHFLTETVPHSLGKIVDVEDWHTVASILQHVYIQASQLSIGTTYSIFKQKNRVRGSDGRMLGYAIEFQGEVEIIKKLPYPENIYKALVKRHNTFVEEGGQVALLNMPSVKLNSEGRPSNVVATVVGGGNVLAPHDFFALHSLVFLDKGSQDGLAVGDILTVQRNQRIRDKSRFAQADTIPIAKIKVAQITPQRTTAFVIESSDAIRIGDYTGP